MDCTKALLVLILCLAPAPVFSQALPQDTPARYKIHQDISLAKVNTIKALTTKYAGTETNQIPAYFARLDSIETDIANNHRISSGEKAARLNSFYRFLMLSGNAIWEGRLRPGQVLPSVSAYQKMLNRYGKGKSISAVIQRNTPEVGSILLQSFSDIKAIGAVESREYVVLETFRQAPAMFFPVLFDFPEVRIADSLITAAARTLPGDLYTYSQAKNSALGKRIGKSSDSLVQLICALARKPDGRLYFPFLDDLYHHKIAAATIAKVTDTGSRIQYYQLLVKTRISYLERLSRNDTPIAVNALAQRLQQSALNDFVYVLNALHNAADPLRLKVLETLNAQELYYLCVLGVDELYTSSYLKIYQRIFKKGSHSGSYALLVSVHFDYFRRFVKMAGTFNTLDDFLSRMDKRVADSVLGAFVGGLNAAASPEDAVDVAESYASIHNEALRRFILAQIQQHIPKSDAVDSSAPSSVYGILNTLFLSLDTANHIDLSAAFGIPPVYRLVNNDLKDDSGSIIIQHFFYGDKDGNDAFNAFLASFSNARWRLITRKYWVEFISLKGTHIHMYANLPLDDNTNAAEAAQQALSDHLNAVHSRPSIVIHRGHSYHVKNTLKYLSPGNKLIFLGSCGGYNNLSQVYKMSPRAQVITTKQEGSLAINQPVIAYLLALLRNGKDLYWTAIWQDLSRRFSGDARFDDYIPPYQNLGAILIMALNKGNAGD